METIYKLEPHRNLSLRGVDRFGAMASLCGCSATGFKVSGVFRDMADFAVLTLWDADDYFGHYQSSKYLPDFDFTDITLDFDITTSGVMPLSSPAFQWIPWRSLSYVLGTGQAGTVDLATHTTYVSGTRTAASATLTLSSSALAYHDEITVWYQNIAFDFIVPGSGVSGSAAYFFQPFGSSPSFTIDGHSFSYTVTALGGDNGATVASTLAGLATGYHGVTCTPSANNINFASSLNTGAVVNVLGFLLWMITDPPETFIAANIVAQINAFSWGSISLPISATAAAGVITVTSTVAGEDGNAITLYVTSLNADLACTPSVAPLSGGISTAIWHVSLDFSALGLANLKQAWLTFAPQIQNATGVNPWPVTDYQATEWLVTVTNWAVTDPGSVRPLKIAGAGSVRVGCRDTGISYSGSSWAEEASNQPGGTGWFNRGYARRMSTPGDSVTIRYSCGGTHNLYVGSSLYTDRGIVLVAIDGGSPVSLDCYYNQATEPVVTRRIVAASVAAGSHTVTITLQSGNHAALGVWDAASSGHYFYFDYLEAAIPSDVPAPAVTYPNFSPAIDFDTDHGYRLSPQRVVWMFQKLGLTGPLDHYLGVFWWNQRRRAGGTFPNATVTFAGTWAPGDSAFLTVSGSTIGKSVFASDTPSTISAHFAYFINNAFSGIRATATGAVLTITNRTPEFSFTLSDSKSSAAGTITLAGSLSGGVEGSWVIDDTVTPVINRAVTDWHTDFWAEVAAAGMTGVASFSMELVNPPTGYAQCYPDGSAVETSTGFGGLNSTQCTFNATFRNYQKQAFNEMAGLMASAGLTPWLQFGEFLWWFFEKPGSGMAYYDADTAAAAATALGRALHTFLHPTDDPSVNGFADADFLAGLIKTHTDAISTFVKATYAGAKFELLWPYDVNYPVPTAIASLGGRLNRYVNLPAAFHVKSGSGLDRLKMEALAFGSTERSFEYAKNAINFPQTGPMAWALTDTAYLIPWFNGGCAWPLEWRYTQNGGIPLVNAWAFDHLCLLSWPLPMPKNKATAQVF